VGKPTVIKAELNTSSRFSSLLQGRFNLSQQSSCTLPRRFSHMEVTQTYQRGSELVIGVD
jgi:hypothetical protein